MPLYEFLCRKCGKEFALVLSLREYSKKGFACSHCSSTDVEQQLSSVSVVTSKKS